jgi:hypothetical protein
MCAALLDICVNLVGIGPFLEAIGCGNLSEAIDEFLNEFVENLWCIQWCYP